MAAFVAVLRRAPRGWILAGIALGGFAVWFAVELAILRELHEMHVIAGLPVIAGGVAGTPYWRRVASRRRGP